MGHADAGQVSGGQEILFGRDQRAQRDFAHWRRWLGVESRCVEPFNSFAGPDNGTFGGRAPVWFEFGDTRPLTCFAGIWTRWSSVRKDKETETAIHIWVFTALSEVP